MIVIGLADVHGNIASIKRMNDILEIADIILLVGDITNFGRQAEIKQVFTSVIHNMQKIRAVSGNCDYPEVDEWLSAQNVNLHGKGEKCNGIGFVGLGGSLITPFQTPNELTEDEIEHCLTKGYSQIPSNIPTILVSHQPPFKTKCDRISSGDHVGSFAVRRFIEKHQPRICFTGHIHESIGMDQIGDTYIINPGKLNKGHYAYAEINEIVEKIEIRSIE
jgi:hypothetical protein